MRDKSYQIITARRGTERALGKYEAREWTRGALRFRSVMKGEKREEDNPISRADNLVTD